MPAVVMYSYSIHAKEGSSSSKVSLLAPSRRHCCTEYCCLSSRGGDKLRLEKYKEEREGKNQGVAKHIEYTILLFVHFFGYMQGCIKLKELS